MLLNSGAEMGNYKQTMESSVIQMIQVIMGGEMDDVVIHVNQLQ
jgi:hypothetical protein